MLATTSPRGWAIPRCYRRRAMARLYDASTHRTPKKHSPEPCPQLRGWAPARVLKLNKQNCVVLQELCIVLTKDSSACPAGKMRLILAWHVGCSNSSSKCAQQRINDFLKPYTPSFAATSLPQNRHLQSLDCLNLAHLPKPMQCRDGTA